jgi:surface polysaccharide O-acyltransferase-like enzyme
MSRSATAPVVNPAWSLMRCIFAFEICLIHVCSLAWYHPQDGWLAETLFISLTRTGTVGFMMLAGALLIGRGPGDAGTYLAHRLRRWLPAILAAQALYLGFGLWAGLEAFEDLTWFDTIEPAWYHIWFFYALATIYIVVVPMRRYDAWAGRLPPWAGQAALWGPVALLMLALTAVTLASGGFWGDLRPVNLLVYFGYAWTGHVLARSFPRGAPGGWWLMVGGVAAAALVTTWASDAAGQPVPHYFHRCTIFVAVGAMGQFLLLLQARGAAWTASTSDRVNRLARLTLGIFVVHPLVIAVAGWPHGWALVASVEWVSMPFAALMLFGLSGAITWLALAALAAIRGPRGMAVAQRGD